MRKITPLAISIIAIALSIIAIVIVFTKHYPRINLDFDYLGLIVGILALLVTVLIGWDIYKAVNIDKYIKKQIENAETEAICLTLSQLGLSLYRTNNYMAALTALVNALSAWKPYSGEMGDKAASHAQDILCKVLKEGEKFQLDEIKDELCILKTIKHKLTNTELLNILGRVGI